MKVEWQFVGDYCYAEYGDVGRIVIDRDTLNIVGKKRIFLSAGYPAIALNKRCVLLHREIMKAKKGEVVDHINNNIFDNRVENLRIVDRSKNAMNSVGHNDRLSSFRGVYYNKRTKKWEANLWKDRKHVWHKRFDHFEDAVNSRLEAERIHFSEYRFDVNSANGTATEEIPIELKGIL